MAIVTVVSWLRARGWLLEGRVMALALSRSLLGLVALVDPAHWLEEVDVGFALERTGLLLGLFYPTHFVLVLVRANLVEWKAALARVDRTSLLLLPAFVLAPVCIRNFKDFRQRHRDLRWVCLRKLYDALSLQLVHQCKVIGTLFRVHFCWFRHQREYIHLQLFDWLWLLSLQKNWVLDHRRLLVKLQGARCNGWLTAWVRQSDWLWR